MSDLHQSTNKGSKHKPRSGSTDPAPPSPPYSPQAEPQRHNEVLDTNLTEIHQGDSQTEAQLARYKDLYNSAPVSYVILTGRGIIHQANSTASKLFGIADLVGQPLKNFIARASLASFETLLRRAVADQVQVSGEVAFVCANKRTIHTHVELVHDSVQHECRLAIVDISDRKKTELAFAENHQQLHNIVDHLPALMWISDENNSWSWVNKGWLDFTGRMLDEELGNGWMQGVHPDDLDKCMEAHAAAFKARQPFSVEFRLKNKNGGYSHMLAKSGPRLSPTGEFLGFIGSCTDISERKNIEESLAYSHQMLRHLVSYQERVREDERKRIAREIHDDLGQNLLALRIDVAMLATRTAGTHPKLNEKVKVALNHIDATMKAVRAAINNLRPTVLDLGLAAAMEWQVSEFQRRSGITCALHMDEKDFRLEDDRATALFRILQESLNNVLRHAQASRVDIELRKNGEKVYMKVADNGVGIYPGCRRKANAFGLIGIEERVNALGGHLHIDSDPDIGTTLMVSIPSAASR